MVPVKIECDCGQHYAFDVEPVNGRMPTAIACPGCGVDGTSAANERIAQHLGQTAVAVAPPVVAVAPPASGGLRVSTAAHTETPTTSAEAIRAKGALVASQFGLVSREQAETEAKAKISWGEAPDAVIQYLMMQSFSYEEASVLVSDLIKVRLADVRKKGISKVLLGLGMMCVPVVAWSVNMMMISFIIMSMCVGIGVWGFFKIITGIFTIAAPKMESGDVAEN
jgi:hypothetical protein